MPKEIKTKYMTFRLSGNKPKTTMWDVVNNDSQLRLGFIEWYSSWRQYVFMPTITFETTYNNGCLQTIADFLTELNQKQRTKPKD